jgi:hypothetical protein
LQPWQAAAAAAGPNDLQDILVRSKNWNANYRNRQITYPKERVMCANRKSTVCHARRWFFFFLYWRYFTFTAVSYKRAVATDHFMNHQAYCSDHIFQRFTELVCMQNADYNDEQDFLQYSSSVYGNIY